MEWLNIALIESKFFKLEIIFLYVRVLIAKSFFFLEF